jgi:hypothetical protein
MANLLVVAELDREGVPRPTTLEVLGQARRISTELGCTLHVLAVVPDSTDREALAQTLTQHGADRICVGTHAHAGELRWDIVGEALQTLCERITPKLLLMGDTVEADEVAARIAARMGAALLRGALVEIEGGGLVLWQGERTLRRSGELEFPVVATLPAGRYGQVASIAPAGDEAELHLLPSAKVNGVELVGANAHADVVIVADADHKHLADKLLEAIGGRVISADEVADAQLAVCLTASDKVKARVRIAVGVKDAKAQFALSGDPQDAIGALVEALAKVPCAS